MQIKFLALAAAIALAIILGYFAMQRQAPQPADPARVMQDRPG